MTHLLSLMFKSPQSLVISPVHCRDFIEGAACSSLQRWKNNENNPPNTPLVLNLPDPQGFTLLIIRSQRSVPCGPRLLPTLVHLPQVLGCHCQKRKSLDSGLRAASHLFNTHGQKLKVSRQNQAMQVRAKNYDVHTHFHRRKKNGDRSWHRYLCNEGLETKSLLQKVSKVLKVSTDVPALHTIRVTTAKKIIR